MLARLAIACVLFVGTIQAVRFVTADPAARAVYNLGVDTALYDRLAWQLAERPALGVIPPTQPPGFIAFLAVIFRAFGHSYLAAKLSFCVLLASTALLVAIVAWRVFGQIEAVLASALTIFSPSLVAYAGTLQYEVLAAAASTAVLSLALLWGPLSVSGRRRLVRAVVLGAAVGVAALIREVLLLIFPILVLDVLWRSSRDGRWAAALSIVAAMTLGLAVPVGAWTLAQRQATGTWVFLSTKSDINLAIGNNPAANGAFHRQLRPIEEPSGWAYIRQRPARTAALALRKAGYFWSVLPEPWSVPTQASVVVSRLLFHTVRYDRLRAGLGIAGALAFLAGAVIVVRRRPAAWIIPATVAIVMLLHLVYFSSARFAVPVQPQIHMTIAVALGAMARAALAHRTAALRTVAIGVVWIVLTRIIQVGGVYRAEAEGMNGISADNVSDASAGNGTARFGAAAGGRRAVVLLAAEAFPRGAFGLGIRARAAACDRPDLRVAELSVRGPRDRHMYRQVLTAGDLCGGGYHAASLVGIVRADNILTISVDSLGTSDLWVDRLEMHFGYRELRQARQALN